MKDENREEFAKCLMGCGEIYNTEITNSIISMWWQCFENFDIGAVRKALMHYVKYSPSQFMPKPGQIMDILLPKATQKQNALLVFTRLISIAQARHTCGNGCPSEAEKQEFVKNEVEKIGVAAAKALRAIGGISEIAYCENKNLQWLEKRFVEYYEANETEYLINERQKNIEEGIEFGTEGKIVHVSNLLSRFVK